MKGEREGTRISPVHNPCASGLVYDSSLAHPLGSLVSVN